LQDCVIGTSDVLHFSFVLFSVYFCTLYIFTF
jgi:hypothetical protein